MPNITLKWIDPLSLTEQFLDQKYITLLYSGYVNNFSGKKSFLAIIPEKISLSLKELEVNLNENYGKCILDRWFGYLSYNLKNHLENLTIDEASYINAPELIMIKYQVIFEFNHISNIINLHANNNSLLDYALTRYNSACNQYISSIISEPLEILNLASNMSNRQYFDAFDIIMEAIKAGDIYQANLTRKFFGNIREISKSKFPIFRSLSSISPSVYSAYLKFEDLEIISSSPEQFITIDKNGNSSTRPIKGTAKRSENLAEDLQIINKLQNCSKNLSENLMITDLMRNDFAKSSMPGSVQVTRLFELSSYTKLHHISSTIISTKDPEISSLDFIKGAFPAGSMTGCPKIKAMEICSAVEKISRGIYSGVLGYISEDGIVDFSVIIRTIIFQREKFEFQCGGAITYESDPEEELEELYLKASAIIAALGIKHFTHDNVLLHQVKSK